MSRLFAFTAFIFSLGKLCSQSAWEVKYLPGFLIPHHEDMAEMMAHIQGIEIGRAWKIDSGGKIDRAQYHPYAGVGVNFFDLGKDINGKSATLFGFYDAGIKLGKKSAIRGRFGVGIGYLTKQYSLSNPKNRAIGSALNGFMQLLTYVQFPVSKRTDLNIGIGMSHYSNGNWSMPNQGINLPALVFGCNIRDLGTRHAEPLKHYVVPNTIQWQLSSRIGRRQIGIDLPKNIAVYILEADIIYPHNAFRQWRFGVLSFFDRTYVFTKFHPLPDHERPDQITELAIQGGHEYRIGRMGFVTDLGLYIYRPDRTKRMYYEGVGIKVYATKNLVIMTRLKAHLTSADYFEWGLAWNFSSKYQVKPGFINGWKWIFSGFKSTQN